MPLARLKATVAALASTAVVAAGVSVLAQGPSAARSVLDGETTRAGLACEQLADARLDVAALMDSAPAVTFEERQARAESTRSLVVAFSDVANTDGVPEAARNSMSATISTLAKAIESVEAGGDPEKFPAYMAATVPATQGLGRWCRQFQPPI